MSLFSGGSRGSTVGSVTKSVRSAAGGGYERGIPLPQVGVRGMQMVHSEPIFSKVFWGGGVTPVRPTSNFQLRYFGNPCWDLSPQDIGTGFFVADQEVSDLQHIKKISKKDQATRLLWQIFPLRFCQIITFGLDFFLRTKSLKFSG